MTDEIPNDGFEQEVQHEDRAITVHSAEVIDNEMDTPDPDVEPYYWKLRDYVRMVAQGEKNALMLNAPPGIGKSYQISHTLKDEVGMEGFRKISGYSTPVELFHNLFEVSDGGVLFLDDIEGLISNKKALALLKQATWSEGNKRYVEWRSTSNQIEVPEQFRFKGQLIMVFNDVPSDDKIFQSLEDRCLKYEIDFSYDERIEICREVAKAEYKDLTLNERQEVVDYIEANTAPGDEPNLRMLFHIFDLRDFNPERWKLLGLEQFDIDDELMLVRSILQDHDTIKGASDTYIEKTGGNREDFLEMYDKLNKDIEEL